jgi:ABC-type bacteriocin/lantibiotic exporter with double-glycine peptidase domain
VGLSTILITSPLAYLFTKMEYKVFEKATLIGDRQITMLQEMVQAISMIKLMASERFWFKRLKAIKEEEMSNALKIRLIQSCSQLV